MGSIVRQLVLGVMALALAVQGVSAATMAYCIPHHPGHPGSAPAAAAHHNAHGAGRPDVESIQRDATASVEKAQAPSSARVKSLAKIAHAKKHKCSSCSSGCFAGALLHGSLVVAAPDPLFAVFDSVTPPVAPFVTGGPDRPPRRA